MGYEHRLMVVVHRDYQVSLLIWHKAQYGALASLALCMGTDTDTDLPEAWRLLQVCALECIVAKHDVASGAQGDAANQFQNVNITRRDLPQHFAGLHSRK